MNKEIEKVMGTIQKVTLSTENQKVEFVGVVQPIWYHGEVKPNDFALYCLDGRLRNISTRRYNVEFADVKAGEYPELEDIAEDVKQKIELEKQVNELKAKQEELTTKITSANACAKDKCNKLSNPTITQDEFLTKLKDEIKGDGCYNVKFTVNDGNISGVTFSKKSQSDNDKEIERLFNDFFSSFNWPF